MESRYVANVRIIWETLQDSCNKMWYILAEKYQQVWGEILTSANFDEKPKANNINVKYITKNEDFII